MTTENASRFFRKIIGSEWVKVQSEVFPTEPSQFLRIYVAMRPSFAAYGVDTGFAGKGIPMFDHSDSNAPSDYARIINIDEAWERGYWSARLEVTETQLRIAISTVGDLVVDVKRHFGK